MGFPENIKLQSNSQPDSYPVATYLFSQRNMERQFDARKGVFLPSFPWCTANALNPSHKSQRIQRSDWVRVWVSLMPWTRSSVCITEMFVLLLNINSGSASFYKKAFPRCSGPLNGYIKKKTSEWQQLRWLLTDKLHWDETICFGHESSELKNLVQFETNLCGTLKIFLISPAFCFRTKRLQLQTMDKWTCYMTFMNMLQ